MNTVYAVHVETGETRQFTEMVWKNIPSDGNHAKGGWKETTKPGDTPEAALKAEAAAKAKAEADKISNEAKNAALAVEQINDLIKSVEAKIKQGVTEYDFNNEMRPYLEAKGKIDTMGKMKMSDIVVALKKEL